jgi:hypothetical protein
LEDGFAVVFVAMVFDGFGFQRGRPADRRNARIFQQFGENKSSEMTM